MKPHNLLAILFVFVGISAAQQKQQVKCAENDEPVGAPLTGWIGYTNTGEPVGGMTVQVFVGSQRPPLATTTTDSAGRFSFPTIGAGTYHVVATKKLSDDAVVSADEDVVVRQQSNRIACLVAEGELIEGKLPR